MGPRGLENVARAHGVVRSLDTSDELSVVLSHDSASLNVGRRGALVAGAAKGRGRRARRRRGEDGWKGGSSLRMLIR